MLNSHCITPNKWVSLEKWFLMMSNIQLLLVCWVMTGQKCHRGAVILAWCFSICYPLDMIRKGWLSLADRNCLNKNDPSFVWFCWQWWVMFLICATIVRRHTKDTVVTLFVFHGVSVLGLFMNAARYCHYSIFT
jgi:hypothetical protein